MDYFNIFIPALIVLFTLTTVLCLHFRKRNIIAKVKALTPQEKDTLLDTLADTIGYGYDSSQDVFVARRDAPQRIFGYTTLFDLSAPYFNMIFDYETIYFDYNKRTWLIEMWKGQYGINTGCELGIYYADKIVTPDEYDTSHFKSVSDKDMLFTTLELHRLSSPKQNSSEKIAWQQSHHWWLTMFKMGIFTNPENLFVKTKIQFKDYYMMYRFLSSFEKNMPQVPYRVNNLAVSFIFHKSNRKYSSFKYLVRRIALTFCNLYCLLFNRITKPFENSGDKVLYLYYYLPFMLRMVFKKRTRRQTKTHK